MPVVKGGVWSNIEDEVLKSAVSKYGLNQWARVSSLLARKTPKQCKARWAQWLDPSIRKVEWSKEEDEKLLHLAKLMPTQWNTIAPIVGRTAQQCLERYQRLLDEVEARENDELNLTGPDGGEGAAPSADDVRRLRPGEVDPDPETKPARPDTVDMDEDEKEMLSEARARLANTQGKKAKRKARERQLEESRRLAALQKRRELKASGINTKIVTRKPGQMDYNADIPFEKAPAPGFYDTQEEQVRNERQREMFDPRKQQLANKRKNDQQDGDSEDRKRRKPDGATAAAAAAAKAGQMQRIREAERQSSRRSLVLPAPQVSESELDDIVKMGMAGERATQDAGDNESTRGLVGDYSNTVGATPLRTPRAPQEEDRIANEVRNAKARTDTQSALLGGENAELLEGSGTTGYQGVAPSKQQISTPNPLATPYRQANGQAVGATPNQVSMGATPMRTPRDSFRLNETDSSMMSMASQTPREQKLAQVAARTSLKNRLASLPRPREVEYDFETPDEQQEISATRIRQTEEDAAEIDKRNRQLFLESQRLEFMRQTQSVQKALPVPRKVRLEQLLNTARAIADPGQRAVAEEAALLIVHDAQQFSSNEHSRPSSTDQFDKDQLERAKMEIALEVDNVKRGAQLHFDSAWTELHEGPQLLKLSQDAQDATQTQQELTQSLAAYQEQMIETATKSRAIEKKLALHLGGYQQRAKTLRQKISEASEALENCTIELNTKHEALAGEDAAIQSRLEGLREDVQAVMRRERHAQEIYRERKLEFDELQSGESGQVNGWH